MTVRYAAVVVLAAMTIVGCKKRTPPAAGPAGTTTAATDDAAARAREQARRDSIAAAERAAREAAERERATRLARARETLSDVIYFEYDSDQLTAESQEKLRQKVAILRANPSLQIRVEGHADERGSTEYNLALGQRRAETVRDYLSGFGIDGSRVNTISYGEERPVVAGSTESAWARNRRAEFAVIGGELSNAPPGVS